MLNLKVRAAPISGNIDNPEGGLDALMQAREREREKTDLFLNNGVMIMMMIS